MEVNELLQRLTDLERRFYPLEELMYEMYQNEIELRKSKDIDKNGYSYKVKFVVDTDKGSKDIVFEVKGYTEKQALFIGNRDVVFPNMSRLKENGTIKWFKTISKEIIK